MKKEKPERNFEMKKKLITKTKSSNKVWIIKSRKSLKYKKYEIIANIKEKRHTDSIHIV